MTNSCSGCDHAIDPVCGMTVKKAGAAHTTTHEEQAYYFCSAGCLKKFEDDPAGYLDGAARKKKQAEGPADAIYTCPMHPEIEQIGPGSCPKCGMALEMMSGGGGMEDDSELRDMSRRFWGALILTVPIVFVAMGEMAPGLRDVIERLGHWNGWLQLILATPVLLWGAWPFWVRAWASLVHRSPNMFTLIALGSGVAYGYSVVAVLFPDLIPEAFRGGHGAVPLYFEAAAVIITLVLLGQVLELRARAKTSGAIRALLELAPKTAIRKGEHGEEEVPVEEVRVGDLLRIKPGARIPVDGTVVEGETTVDESMLTGEPGAVSKKPGDTLTGASVNERGSVLMRAESVGDDTILAQIVNLVASAQRSRAPVQQLVDKVASYFVPTVVVVALITFVVWSLWGPEPAMAYGLVNAVAVLIIACPCALGLATPMSIMVATGRGAREGVLFKNAEALEHFQRVTVVAVDKTGTLTEGKPTLVSFKHGDGLGEEALLGLVASVEQRSEHPLAGAIVAQAKERSLTLSEVEAFDSHTGKGVSGRVGDQEVLVGSGAFMVEHALDLGHWEREAEALRDEGQTVIYGAVDGQVMALMGIADPIKATTAEAVKALQDGGLRVVMITGDNERTARAIARKLHIDEVHAEQLPEQKHGLIEGLQAQGEIVAMAGDGINDAPALARADVGIAMGHGADIAMESAGVTLVKGDLRGVLRAHRLSRETLQNIRQNLVLAFGYNTLAIPVAAGLLYPFTGWLLSPMIAAAAMSLSSVSVIGNALRLRH